ncbi:hypothetical protein [Streptomyces sp. NPDC049555]|uniref:hypothetical protein n=1 Tax=unclassified Streptomyces TaxID=2593676 RepID=UPI0034407CA2
MAALPSESSLTVVPPLRAPRALRPTTAPVGRHARPRLGLYDSWRTVGAAGAAVCVAWAAAVWVAMHLQADASLHSVALFVHLSTLVLGFGAVLVADYWGLLWMTGRCTLTEALGSTSRLHVPIWAGLVGLVFSGLFLHPNPFATPTLIKMVLVLVLTLNGLQAGLLDRRMAEQAERRAGGPTNALLAWGGATAVISQICWWGAVIIGFRNSTR